MKNLEIIILAAGQGTRMKSSKPKIFHELGGKQIIDYVIDVSIRLKPKMTHLIVNSQIKSKFKNYKGLNIVIQKKQNGTGDAIKSVLKSLNKNSIALVLYGDVPLINHKTILNVSKINNNQVNVLCFNKEEKNTYGKVILGTDGSINDIIEQKELKKNENYYLCNSGIFAIQTKLLISLLPKLSDKNKKKEFYLTDIFKLAFEKKVKVTAILSNESEVMGINDKNDLAKAEKEMQVKLRLKHLKGGVTMIDPDTVYLSNDTKIGKDVTIHPFVTIGKNVIIGNNTQVFSFSHLENCKIGNKVNIGPYARIRPGTKIGNNVGVGNFVEIKNSTVGEKSKLNHLSYVGDSNLGKNVNIGAGTITCNYDGSQKNKTIIKDNAFIGSNSSLVAPIKIERNAYIGSGSTITKNVDANSLAVERSLQKEVKNWSKKRGKK
jgi:bifunctional UDP-N-acetylglucosamine pyrophosphorylase/glucosamine-1-phosphate N-acetyltransferase